MAHDILSNFSDTDLVKTTIKANWENYHYCLGRAPSVELSVGRYLTWLVTAMPDHFMNMVVCTDLPQNGKDSLIEGALDHFKSLNVQKLCWLAKEGVDAAILKEYLTENGLTFREAFATEMAIDLDSLSQNVPTSDGLHIVQVDDDTTLRDWIRVASVGFGLSSENEQVWFDFFNYAACGLPFQTYLAYLDGKPVGTSQLFISAGVAGIYNVSALPEVRGRGIGTAITLAPLLDAKRMGYHVSVLQASKAGYKVYQKLGFEDFGKMSLFLWENNLKA